MFGGAAGGFFFSFFFGVVINNVRHFDFAAFNDWTKL
jgi:hypothetical protein